MSQDKFDHSQKLKENISILIENEKLNEAKQLLELYEQIIQDDVDIYSMEGVIAIKEGDLNQAENILKEGERRYPCCCDILYNLAFLYETAENTVLAYQYYRKLLVLCDELEKAEINTKILELEESPVVFDLIQEEQALKEQDELKVNDLIFRIKVQIKKLQTDTYL